MSTFRMHIQKIFDADKVQGEINAQVQITQAFGKEATKVGAQFAQDQINKVNALKALAGGTSQIVVPMPWKIPGIETKLVGPLK